MKNDKVYDDKTISSIVKSCDSAISAIRYSSNKNDAIKTLQKLKIEGTNVTYGDNTAHKIYDIYSKYNGNKNRRKKN